MHGRHRAFHLRGRAAIAQAQIDDAATRRGRRYPAPPADEPIALHAAILHPRPVVWPAVSSVGAATMDAVLDARVRGYQATIVIGATLDARRYALCSPFSPFATGPTTRHQSRFSPPHAVAVVATRGKPTRSDFEPDAIAALAEMRTHVTVREDAAIAARYPECFGGTVGAGGGRVTLMRGDPQRPLARDGAIGNAWSLFAWSGLDDNPAAIIGGRGKIL